MKYLKNEDAVIALKTRKELLKYLSFRKENDRWVSPVINRVAAIGVPNHPLFFDVLCKNIKVKLYNSFVCSVPDVDTKNEDHISCITHGTGIFLVAPYGGIPTPIPTATFAYEGICSRGGDTGTIMMNFSQKENKGVLPVEEKAERLTRDFSLMKQGCNILIRDGMVCAMHSEGYVIIPADEAIAAFEEELKRDYEYLEYANGFVSHAYLYAEYLLKDELAEGAFQLILEKGGKKVDKVEAGVVFYTSDVGDSSVTASIYYKVDGKKIQLGESVRMPHKGDASVEKFRGHLKNMGRLFKEGEERIEELGNIPILHPSEVLLTIRESNPWLPKAITTAVAEELKLLTDATAIDVYIALNEIIDRKKSMEGMSPEAYINLCEQVAKLLYFPYGQVDAEC